MYDSNHPGAEPDAEPVSFAHLLIAFAVVSALWFVFVGTKALHELEVGFAVAVVTTFFAAFVSRHCAIKGRFRPTDLLQAWRIPWYVISDIAEITLVLAKDLLHLAPAKSLFRVVPFSPGDTTEVTLGRRVLATAFTTATPSIIVIGVDVEGHRMLFHQIRRSHLPIMTKNLGAHS